MIRRHRARAVAADRARVALTLVTVGALLAGCAATATPAPSPEATPRVPASASVASPPAAASASAPGGATSGPSSPAASATPPPSAVGVTALPVAGPWQPAGSMAVSRLAPHAVLLANGRVLVVGNDLNNGLSGMVRADSATAEVWDPAANAWQATSGLNRPRAGFAAIGLRNGGALVTGGLDLGRQTTSDPAYACTNGDALSYSSTYVWDPTTGTWTRAGLLGMARTQPSIAALPDGRALLVGGFYETPRTGVAADAALAAFRHPAPDAAAGLPADIAPNFTIPALATAELFDPATRIWSSTGPMHYARYGAAAATLADGRVLVVGSDQGTWISNGGAVDVSDAAANNAELYDPRTGRFTLTGSLPATGRESGVYDGTAGTLVALPDGGALLVANERSWKHGPTDVRSFRYDVGSGSWAQVGNALIDGWDSQTQQTTHTGGEAGLTDSLVARLADGRVLVAGGDYWGAKGLVVSRAAYLYDPRTNAWSRLSPMPAPRAGGAAVGLPNGTAVLVGGYADDQTQSGTCDRPVGLASAIRYVPTR
jgi:Kelch motif